MAIDKTTTLTNSVRARYENDYRKRIRSTNLYDQIAVPVGADMSRLAKGSSVVVPFISVMDPGVTAISESADVTPQALKDATASVTPTSRGEALQCSELIMLQAYTDYGAQRYEIVADNQVESVALLAQDQAYQGSWRYPGTARASLNAGTTTDYIQDTDFSQAQAMLETMRVPGFWNEEGRMEWVAYMHPFVFHDLRNDGHISSVGDYQQSGIHLNYEMGKLGPFRLISTAKTKIFKGAGADNATAVATTLAAKANALSTTITTADDVSANIAAGTFWYIGTEETANTHYPKNETIKVLSASTTTLTIMGEGENGGLRYEHASGTAVRNADSAYPVLFAGKNSLVKVYQPSIGEFGMTVGPKVEGLLDQWVSLGWKYYGGYGRLVENRILRLECSVSAEA